MDISSILTLLCGVAFFLYGMSMMGDNLKKVAGNKMETILYKLTNTPLKGLLLGTGVTAIIQSSGATTVMIVGFVNSGMMKVAQAIGIIMGANIGTSITGWILCLSYIGDGSGGNIARLLSSASISAIFAITGMVIKMFAKKRVYRSLGDIMIGFAVLMTGMQMMSGAVSGLKNSPTFVNTITMFRNPILGILAGIVITIVLQSASASVGVIQALSVTGGISFEIALPVIMGIGIGASCPVLLSAIGTNKDGKRTALVYLLNDFFGMLICSIIFYTVNAFAHFEFVNTIMSPVSVAFLNTLFRMATVAILLPCMKLLEKLVFWLIKDKPEDEEEKADFSLLDERFLNYPALAIPQIQQVMNDVAKRSRKAVKRAMGILTDYSDETFNKIQTTEALVDKYEDKLGTYLIQLSSRKLTPAQTKNVTKFLYTISDFESLSDYALNIAFVGSELHEQGSTFSDQAQKELKVLKAAIVEMVDLIIDAFVEENLYKAKRVEPLREFINELSNELKERHVNRLSIGVCVLDDGNAFNDILANIERLCAHCSNIAVAMNKLEASSLHSNTIIPERGGARSDEYYKYLREYENKYSIKEIPTALNANITE